MNNNKIIGFRISAALAQRNKLQKDLAQHLEVTDNTISYFCGGKRTPNISQIIKISEFLNVSTDYLLGKDVPMTSDISVHEIVKKTGLSEDIILRLIAWNNIDNSTLSLDESAPEYLKQIAEDLTWIPKQSNLVIEFSNCLLSAYIESPRLATLWFQGYMYSLYTWFSALKTHNEHQIFLKEDEVNKSISKHGLVTLPANESAKQRLSSIMRLIENDFSDKVTQIVLNELDRDSSSESEN